MIHMVIQTHICSSALARFESADTKTDPSLQPLSIIRSIDLICHLWQQYINTALLPLASSSVTIRREMVVFNNQTVNRMETGTNSVLQRITDGKNTISNCLTLTLTLIYISDYQLAHLCSDEAET